MAKTRGIEPVVRFVAVISRRPEVVAWAHRRVEDRWGEIRLAGEPMPFEAGGYYTDEMGAGLQKTLFALWPPCDPAGLADWKLETNRWEQEAASEFAGGPVRPLNLDPGYITQAKLVLATVKDRDHRIYLRDGIFAEVTLSYTGGRWVDHRWTYPDYRTEPVRRFADDCRGRLRTHLKQTGGFRLGQKNSFSAPPRDGAPGE